MDTMTTSQLDTLTRKQSAHQDGINWVTASFMVLFHIGALAAVFFFTWKALFVAIFLWWLTTSLGIGMGYHRLLTHRGYKTPKWVEYVLTVFATISLEGGPIFWVATHRIHHRYSDHEGDPHSPVDGKWWAHMGWILFGKSMHHDTTTLAQYVPDLAKDKFHVWITKYNYVPIIALAIILYAIGGLPFVFWGIFVRTVVGLHATWLVNSATHTWGKRRFQTRDRSTNSWWVALLTWGEGWHNNHHAHPVSARHGLKWYEIDFNWYGIWIMKKLRLARQVHCAKILSPQHEDEILPAESQPQPNLIPPKAAENFG
jgi:sn-1 stearoyl-lipid 9-desaturase